jgi:hypothetical protein
LSLTLARTGPPQKEKFFIFCFGLDGPEEIRLSNWLLLGPLTLNLWSFCDTKFPCLAIRKELTKHNNKEKENFFYVLSKVPSSHYSLKQSKQKNKHRKKQRTEENLYVVDVTRRDFSDDICTSKWVKNVVLSDSFSSSSSR